jgi:hypothetical protein
MLLEISKDAGNNHTNKYELTEEVLGKIRKLIDKNYNAYKIAMAMGWGKNAQSFVTALINRIKAQDRADKGLFDWEFFRKTDTLFFFTESHKVRY